MTIAIIGPGALGSLLLAQFLQAGEQVYLVDYRPERVASLRQNGLIFHTLEGRSITLHPLIFLPDDAPPAHLIIITVKSYHTAAAALVLPRLLAPQGVVLTLQNGLGNLEALARVLGPSRLLAGVIFAGATRVRDGEVICAGLGPTYLGIPPDSQVTHAELDDLVALFQRAGLPCEAHGNIQVMIWEKLLVNVAVNPLTAILRVKNGVLLNLPPAWELALAAAQEAKAVAWAAGVPVTADPEQLLSRVCSATADNRSSMLQDLLARRRTEIHALNAQVTARGETLGLPTPVNTCLTQLIRALEYLNRNHQLQEG